MKRCPNGSRRNKKTRRCNKNSITRSLSSSQKSISKQSLHKNPTTKITIPQKIMAIPFN